MDRAVIFPLGLDWRCGVAILLSFITREVFVSALVVIFSLSSDEVSDMVSSLQQATFEGTDQLIFTTPTIVGLILFFMVAMQCVATLAVAKKEMRSWKLPMIQLVGYIVLAYVLAFLGRLITQLVF